MELKSLGYQTELLFRSFEGEVVDKEDYLVIQTPKNPGYRWGNFLLFPNPPQSGDLEKWKVVFAKEIGKPPKYNHFVFTWDGVDGDVGEINQFLEAGFEIEKTAVMTATQVNPPAKVNHDCFIRPFTADDWPEWVELHVVMNQGEPEEDREDDSDGGFSRYLWRKADEYQRMIEAGQGQWFGAFVDGRLASSMGLFVWDKLGRFQMVDTHPDFRRRGLAGTLVYEVAQKGFNEMGAETLVMCTDPDYVALKLYESVGFKSTETMVGLEWTK
ncbi:MAG: GNAT family N-acetyltransferase [Anaerolineae bacterium]